MIVLVAVFGLVIGSFLNVVIFRLPRDLPVYRPRWSFCPHCKQRIRPWDNVPVLSWLLLRGRCASCGKPISEAYPLIELSTALVFVLVWDALFVTQALPSVSAPARDWPVAVACLFLFAALLATAAMDIESYTIDIRPVKLAAIVGIVCHFLRGFGIGAAPTVLGGGGAGVSHDSPAGLLPPALCLVVCAMGLAWCLTLLVGLAAMSRKDDPREAERQEDGSTVEAETSEQSAHLDNMPRRFRPFKVVGLGIVTLLLIVWQMGFADWPGLAGAAGRDAGHVRGAIGTFVVLVVLLGASAVQREADTEVIEAIEAERTEARRTALHEFAWLLPALVAGAVCYLYLRVHGGLLMDVDELLGDILSTRWLTHVHGALQSLAAMTLAAGTVFGVRIVATLAFGKEALGTGDVYIIAAVGAVLGLWAALVAFLLGSILALLGQLVLLFHKRSRAIPFVPWLALGALGALWLLGGVLVLYGYMGRFLWALVSGQPTWLAAG